MKKHEAALAIHEISDTLADELLDACVRLELEITDFYELREYAHILGDYLCWTLLEQRLKNKRASVVVYLSYICFLKEYNPSVLESNSALDQYTHRFREAMYEFGAANASASNSNPFNNWMNQLIKQFLQKVMPEQIYDALLMMSLFTVVNDWYMRYIPVIAKFRVSRW